MRVEDIREEPDVYNPIKPAAHLEKILALRRGEIITPTALLVHPEAFCPHDCSFCSYRVSGPEHIATNFLTGPWIEKEEDRERKQISRPRGKLKEGVSGLPKEIGLDLPRQMAEAGIPAVELTGSGEPTVWPNIRELLHEFKKYGLEVAMATNGQYMKALMEDNCFDPDKFKWVRFSMDSARAETHQKVHGIRAKKFIEIVENIRIARDKYPNTVIGISYIVTPGNYQEIVEAAILYKALGLDNIRYSFEYSPGKESISPEIKEEAEKLIKEARALQNRSFRVFSRAQNWQDDFTKPNDDFSYCGYMQFTWNIGYDAKVYPCCIEIYKPSQVMGDLRKQTIKEIIESPEYKEFIRNFNVQNCDPCWLRPRNKTIEQLVAPEKRIGHVNYV